MSIEDELEQALWSSCRESRTLGYKPTAFESMLNEHGAVEAAHRLLARFEYQDGFRRLWDIGRLDLSLECHVLKPKYRELFSTEELEEARKRLRLLNHDPLQCEESSQT
ncbi:MAG: hypothetical protein OXG51_03710 [Gammaproteobacteria bacterium]|nr:hypothetical protein [Gammaproteobacteria bacterium]